MRQFQPVIWSKGTFLSPQHLQTQERFVEDCSRFYLDALQPWHWGFRKLAIDHQALAEGRLALASASGVLPDALPIDIPDSDVAPQARELSRCFQPGQQSCTFFLTVPEYQAGGMNVAIHRTEVVTRFRAEPTMVSDENTGRSDKPVQIARKNLRLLSEHESREGSVLMGCVRIKRSEAGSYSLDGSYIPPLIDIQGHAGLTRLFGNLIELLVSRVTQLLGTRGQKREGLADFTASDVANFWMLYTLNSHLPVLRHFLESKGTGPEQLYLQLAQLAGSLTSFSSEIAPQDLPIYRHDDLGGTFTALDAVIRTLLDTVIPSNFVALPLNRVRDTFFATSIEKDAYFDGSIFYLAVTSDLRDAELIERTPRLLIAGSSANIEGLVQRAISGLRLRHVPTPPRAIPVKLRQQYFAVETSGPEWESVLRHRNFAVYAPAELLNPKLELIIVLSKPL
jgi:type VI secretion system protein ImpJ